MSLLFSFFPLPPFFIDKCYKVISILHFLFTSFFTILSAGICWNSREITMNLCNRLLKGEFFLIKQYYRKSFDDLIVLCFHFKNDFFVTRLLGLRSQTLFLSWNNNLFYYSRGYSFIWSRLRQEDVYCYWKKLLKRYASLQNYTIKLDSQLIRIT